MADDKLTAAGVVEDALPRGAAQRLKSLDMLVDMQEPELLMIELKSVAERYALLGRGSGKWGMIADRVGVIVRELDRLNEPKARE